MHDTGGAVCADVLTFYPSRFSCFKALVKTFVLRLISDIEQAIFDDLDGTVTEPTVYEYCFRCDGITSKLKVFSFCSLSNFALQIKWLQARPEIYGNSCVTMGSNMALSFCVKL